MSAFTRTFATCLLAATALLTTANPALAQRERPQQAPEVRGTVKSVDAANITITLGGRGMDPAEKTYALGKNVEVCTGAGGFRFGGAFQEAKLADLSAGTFVSLTLTADQKTVESILAEEPTVRGTLKSVDAKKKQLTVETQPAARGEAPQESTYAIAAAAEIGIDDGRGRRFSIREGKLEDLKQGSLVTLRLSLDKKQVNSVYAEGAMIAGTLKSVDAANGAVTIVTRPARGDDAAEEKTVTVAKEAVIVTDDGKGRRLSAKQVKLADVPVGSAVQARLSVDQNAIMMLRAEGPMLFGMLKGVDADKGTITIGIPKSRTEVEEKVLNVAKDARITLDGKPVKLADLKPAENGPFLQVRLTLDQKSVQGVIAREPGSR